MTTRRPILLLVNPVSGGRIGSPDALRAEPDALEPAALLAALQRRGLAADLHVLEEDHDPGQLAERAARDGMDVVVAGGDGTVALAAGALCGTEATLGILATGSWNNVATSLGATGTLDGVLDAISRGDTARVDAGLAWHSSDEDEEPPADAARFFEAAGVGLDAAGFGATVLRERRGTWVAVRSAWRALRKRRTRMLVTVDGRRMGTSAPAVTICIGPYMGLGFAIAPEADPSDGLLNVVVFSGMSPWDVLRHYLAVARHRPRREPRMERLTARRVTISGAARVLPAHADGRSIGTTPVSFGIDPGALRIFR